MCNDWFDLKTIVCNQKQCILLIDSGSDEAGSAKWEPGSGSGVGSEERQWKGVGSGVFIFLSLSYVTGL